jgi:hypothetical protein
VVDRSTTIADVLSNDASRAAVERHLPGLLDSPVMQQATSVRLGQLAEMMPEIRENNTLADALWADLADIDDGRQRVPYAPRREPDPDYEDASIPSGSAPFSVPAAIPRWGVIEVVIEGPSHGNPFVDVELTATFTQGDRTLRAGGFYDGAGIYKARLLAEDEGEWTFETTSTARSLDGLRGSVTVGPSDSGSHGPVQVDGFHFQHADGTRHRPLGTTCYAWTHQGDDLEERTLSALKRGQFTKMRMCLFPKSYLYNSNEPPRYPFERRADGSWDVERFNPDFFAHLERRIDDLAALGLQADLILFHAYDRWGFADLGPAVDDRVVSYVVRRLAAYANVWWSMANEYDLLWAKTRTII